MSADDHDHDVRLIAQLTRSGQWPLTNHDRQRAVDVCLKAMQSPKPKTALAAVKTLALLDSVNVRRERATVQERQGEARLALESLQAALAQPDGQELLSALTARLTAPTTPAPAAQLGDSLSPSTTPPDASTGQLDHPTGSPTLPGPVDPG